MKKRISKDIILFIILIPLFLLCIFFISNRIGDILPKYSVINKSRTGLSVFYEALKEFKYPVERTLNPINTNDSNTIQITTGTSNLDYDDIMIWVGKGGTLIHLETGEFDFDYYEIEPIAKGSIRIYKYQRGTVIATDANNLTNKTLTKRTQEAYELLQEIGDNKNKKIYFNETNLFSAENKKSLWDYVPLGIKYMFYQLIVILLAFFYYKGKRFGRAVPLHEEVERSENEYLYSAASLYRQAKCWDLIIDSYYKSFLRLINNNDDNWLEYWEREKLSSYNKAKRVYEFMNSLGEKPRAKEYIQVITTIEHLKNILKKRRDSFWKTLRK